MAFLFSDPEIDVNVNLDQGFIMDRTAQIVREFSEGEIFKALTVATNSITEAAKAFEHAAGSIPSTLSSFAATAQALALFFNILSAVILCYIVQKLFKLQFMFSLLRATKLFATAVNVNEFEGNRIPKSAVISEADEPKK